ncbi:hypothetical protein F5B22DRAFT_431452 [Xylaria bambusicola]|uniref:uncharacterized protein n=1 Tax=Xylaria bambusicola TaxID=326684 RepID=UPI0020080762|nr:uncharacterized protein F5B22DRAFT_431452 [Xylaria bambusicola]KAI0506968.1 hypothetical protein F5B22DRAFT_431452 [Xylaria bambusicola]
MEGTGSVRTLMDSLCWALYGPLASHRRHLAVTKGIAPVIIAQNTLLQALAMHRPSNNQELLRLPGVRERKALQYGESWLGIITKFEAEQKQGRGYTVKQEADNQTENSEIHTRSIRPDPKRRKIVGVGRSKEILSPSDQPPAVFNTGISFQLSKTSLTDNPPRVSRYEAQRDEGRDNDSSDDDDAASGPPMQPPSPATLKCRRDLAAGAQRRRPPQSAVETLVCITGSLALDAATATKSTSTSRDDLKPRAAAAPPISPAMSTASHRLVLNGFKPQHEACVI